MTFDYVSLSKCLRNAYNNKNTRMHAVKLRSIFGTQKSKRRGFDNNNKNWQKIDITMAQNDKSAFTLFGIYLFAHTLLIYFLLSIYFGDGAMFAQSTLRVIGWSEMPMRDVSNPYPFNICFIHFLNSCSLPLHV